MSNYSDDEATCRVDFFKESGKWYTKEAVQFPGVTYTMSPADALAYALKTHFDTNPRYLGMTAVCLQPYVANSFPVMIQNVG